MYEVTMNTLCWVALPFAAILAMTAVDMFYGWFTGSAN